MTDRNAPIGVFDSGIGGLTVVREIMRQLPNEKIIYFGDTARVPYGNKSRETVIRYSEQIVRFLQASQVKAIVVACNTASAVALDELEYQSQIPIIGVVKPGAKVAADTTRNGKIGIIGTEVTVSSGIYSRYIQQLNQAATVIGKACPLFVPLVEEGLLQDAVTDEIARRYLAELIDTDIDTLILGCTHYPLLRSTVARVMGNQVTLVNPAYETAKELKELLEENQLLKGREERKENEILHANEIYSGENHPEEEKYRFYVSDGAEKFKKFATSIIKYGILPTKIINIEEY